MNAFEYLFVIVAIVLALGLAELLGGVVRILRGDLKSHPFHALWIVVVFQLQVQLAWGLWGLHRRAAWRYPEFLLLLSGPIVVYLIAALLYPTEAPERADVHLLRRRRPFFLLQAAYVGLTALYGWFLFGEGWLPAPTMTRLVVVGALVAAAITPRKAVQWAVGLLVLGGNLWWTYYYVFVLASTPAGP